MCNRLLNGTIELFFVLLRFYCVWSTIKCGTWLTYHLDYFPNVIS